jgi:predicted Zn-dependent peptidase
MRLTPLVHYIETEQFKTVTIAMRWIGPYSVATINHRVLMPQVLLAGTKKHPGKQAMQLAFDLNYGSSISANSSKIGRQSVISFQTNVINEELLGVPVYEPIVAFFHEIISQPRLRSGAFVKQVVNEEKSLLQDSLDAVFNDKVEYSYQRMRQHMFAGELFCEFDGGRTEGLAAISAAELTQTYTDMIEHDALEIYIVGNAKARVLKPLFEAKFALRKPIASSQWLDKEDTKRVEAQRIQESAPIKQAKINIGYRASTWYDDADVFAMFVFNTMFGDSEQSALFQTVREQHHLAYYVQSSYHHNKGFLSVMAGVEPAMVNQAIDAIAAELQKIQNGEFSDADLELAKMYLAEQQRRGLDSPAGLIQRHFNYRHQLGRDYDITLFQSLLERVTKADVIRAAAKVRLDTVYVLTEEDHHEAR